MRDAFGGSFMLKLFIVFIFIYVFFIAIALNYAKAFKVKNKIIEYIETHEIVDITSMNNVAYTELEDFVNREIYGKLNYYYNAANTDFCRRNDDAICFSGITIVGSSDEDIADSKFNDNRLYLGKKKSTVIYDSDVDVYAKYYTVYVAVPWEIGFLNKILELNNQNGEVGSGSWTISGETRLIASET